MVKKYGYPVQEKLDVYISIVGIDTVDVGTIVEGRIENMPWKRVFHTVATNLNYLPDYRRRYVDSQGGIRYE